MGTFLVSFIAMTEILRQWALRPSFSWEITVLDVRQNGRINFKHELKQRAILWELYVGTEDPY